MIAGVNGAGKSSIAGASIREAGGEYFNPDEIARDLRTQDSELSQFDANAKAWAMGHEQLVKAISLDADYTFETTLGGNTITQCLFGAIKQGIEVRIFYCGLATVDLHIERVRERVLKGGHDIPEEKIRERYTRSMHNLMTLLPGCYQVDVLDNSAPLIGGKPTIIKLFRVKAGQVEIYVDNMPDWAKPLATIGLRNFSLV